MYLLYTDERSTFITKSVIKEKTANLTTAEFICLSRSIANHKERCTVIFDVDYMNEDVDLVGHRIREVLSFAPSTGFIAFAPGYDLRSNALMVLANSGVRHFITAENQADMKDELRDILENGEENRLPLKEALKDEAEMPDEADAISCTSDRFRSSGIAVIGALPRIGTSTQAVQIAKSILFNGSSVCYVEMNTNGLVKDIRNTYGLKDKGGYIRADGLDMYFYRESTSDLYRKYDHIVFDYGSLSDSSNLLSYFDKDVRICVAGSSPSEGSYLYDSLKRLKAETEKVHYIFSFTPDDDRKAVEKQMKRMRNLSCSFASYTPDMFILDEANEMEIAGILSLAGNKKEKTNLLKKLIG